MEHSALVRNLRKNGEQLKSEVTGRDLDLLHAAVGVSGEAGELLDSVKKHVIYRKPLDLENVKEELGDLEFFMEHTRQILGITREETIQGNIAKLLKRYPTGFSNEAAQARADKA